MNKNLIDIVAILTALLLLIFAVFVFNHKTGRLTSNKILSAFLFANSLFIIDFSLPAIENSTGLYLAWFNGVGFAFGFLFGPLLYLYTKSITHKDFSLSSFHLLHTVAFVIAFLQILINFSVPFVYIAFHLLTSSYLIVSIVVIINYKKMIKNYYSSIEKLNLTWMLYVVGAFFIMWMVDLFTFILFELKMLNPDVGNSLTFLSLLINFSFAIMIFYKALQHPEIFKDTPEIKDKHQKYEHSRLTENEKREYLQILEQYFDTKKPFLNPELTIADVASKLNISTKNLSQVINESLQKNFYDFINSYRIQEAKQFLKYKDNSKKTVLEILYDSGFNSKSAFNTAFKKQTGYTPSQYRQQKQRLVNH